MALRREALAALGSDAETAAIDTPLAALETTMNRLPTTPLSATFAAFAGAAVMTLATVLGVGQLANHSSAEMQMAHAKSSPVQLAGERTAQPAS